LWRAVCNGVIGAAQEHVCATFRACTQDVKIADKDGEPSSADLPKPCHWIGPLRQRARAWADPARSRGEKRTRGHADLCLSVGKRNFFDLPRPRPRFGLVRGAGIGCRCRKQKIHGSET
jgi:hypothetical protein